MASGSNTLTTYYAKRIIGDAAAATNGDALLQTGTGITSNMWILNQTKRFQESTSLLYGVKYIYDSSGHDALELYGGTTSSDATVTVALDTGNTSISGITTITNTTSATSTSTGALQVTGGAGIGGKLYIGNDVNSAGHLYLAADKDIFMKYGSTNYDVVSNYNNGNVVLTACSGSLYIGYRNTANTYIYCSNSNSAGTKFFEVNSNGATAATRFGVNGQNTGYTLYVNGTGYYTDSITVTKAGECGTEVENTSQSHKVAFIVGSSGNGGIYDRTKSKWIVYSDTSGNVYLNGNANTATESKYLMNRGNNTVSIVDNVWSHGHTPTGHTNGQTVWHQGWKQTGLTYTPSGGEATAITDYATLLFWLSNSNTSNALQLNMAIDGDIYSIGEVKAKRGYFTGVTRVQYATPNVYIKDTSTSANTYAILRFGNKNTDDGAYIFLNGPSRTSDGGANMFTIRNNVGDLRLDNNVLNTGTLTVENTLTLTDGIYYKGTKATKQMIGFVDNTSDVNGNGITIGGDGLVMLGSGESVNTLKTNLSITAGGTEQTYISSDNDITFYASQNTFNANYKMIFSGNKLTVGVAGTTTAEAQIRCASGAGELYMYSGAATDGSRGIYVPAHGTGSACSLVSITTDNLATFYGALNLSNERVIVAKIARKKDGGGGWEYAPLQFYDNADSIFAKIGVYGNANTMTYMYIGANAYNSANNLRITPNGTVIIPNSTDASGTAANNVALIIGGEQTAEHIEIDGNEILAKSNGTTPGTLFLQDGAGTVQSSGTGGLIAKNGRLKTRSSESFPGIDFISNDSTGATGGTIAMNMAQTNSKYRADRFYFRCYTYDSSTGATSSVYEQFRLPDTTAGRSSNATYEIITTKGLSGNIPILHTITKGTKPSASVARQIAFTDSTGSTASDHLLGLIYSYVGTDGLARMRMYVHDNIASATSSSYFGIYHTTQSASTLVRRTEGNVKIYGAVWNDYAEYRASYTEEPGRVVQETPEGKLKLVNERLAPGARIISDTFGFAIGETKEYNAPIAVSGRVLAYTYRDRNEYPLGAAVCSAPNGTIDIMTRDEIMMYPERILGTVSEIPKYEYWYGGDGTPEDNQKVAVNNRIWIYVK